MVLGDQRVEKNWPCWRSRRNSGPMITRAAVAPRTPSTSRPDDFQLGLEPRAARGDLRRAGRLVDAPLAALGELEVLHGVRDVHVLAVQSDLDQRAVEHLAGRTDEGRALAIFLIAGLLAHQHDACSGRARPKTVWVAWRKRSQPWQRALARAELVERGVGGMNAPAPGASAAAPGERALEPERRGERLRRRTCGSLGSASRSRASWARRQRIS